MKTSSAPAKPRLSPPLAPLTAGASDEDRYFYLLAAVAPGIYSQFEQTPHRNSARFANKYDGDEEEERSKQLSERCAMATSDLMAEFDAHRQFKAKC